MGFADLKNFLVKKLFSMPEGLGGKLACCSGFVSVVFFIAAVSAGLFSTLSIRKTAMITEFHYDVLRRPDGGNLGVTFPQVVFCPLWDHAYIKDIKCYDSNSSWFAQDFPLQHQVVLNGSKMNNPNWQCYGYNMDGKAIVSPQTTMFCSLNATVDNATIPQADALVRVFIDQTGTPGSDILECQNCVDGIDGTILVQNSTTLAFWAAEIIEADHIDDDDDTVIEYRTTMNRMPTQPQLGETSNMDIVLGFYTMSVWEFKGLDKFADRGPIGEGFGRFVSLTGGCALFAYGLHIIISTFLTLLFVGDAGGTGSTSSSGEKRALLG